MNKNNSSCISNLVIVFEHPRVRLLQDTVADASDTQELRGFVRLDQHFEATEVYCSLSHVGNLTQHEVAEA